MTSPVKVWRNQKKITKMLGKSGRIVSWTIVRVPPGNFSYQAPYPVAIVRLTNGRNIIAQVVDCEIDEIKFQQKVVTIVRRTARPETSEVIPYGIKVKPT
jgi:hypothetical protein